MSGAYHAMNIRMNRDAKCRNELNRGIAEQAGIWNTGVNRDTESQYYYSIRDVRIRTQTLFQFRADEYSTESAAANTSRRPIFFVGSSGAAIL